jgi:hypothetical protein
MSHLVKFVADQILQFWPPYSIPDDGNWGRGGYRADGEHPVAVPQTERLQERLQSP